MAQPGRSKGIQEQRRQQAERHRHPDGRPMADPRRQPAGQDLVKEALRHTHCEARSGMERFATRFRGFSVRTAGP